MASDDLPALLGGRPVRPEGPPDWPLADVDVLEALRAAYTDTTWGKYHGGHCERLEEALRVYHGVDHAMVCGSGTYAIELALRALKIGPGDEVIMAAYDYSGNFLAVHAVGAQPVLIDIDPKNWNLTPDRVADGLGPKVKAIIASHLHGGLAPMHEVMACASDCGLAVIEDAAQCPGAVVAGKKAGTWGDIGILSFGGSKLLTAGRGGALLTSRSVLHQRARATILRGNLVCPMSELQAAVLLPQLRKLDERNQHRERNARGLCRRLAGVPGVVSLCNLDSAEDKPVFYKLGFRFDAQTFGLPRARFVAAMRAEGIAFDEGFAALHVGRSPKRFRRGSSLEESERAHEGAVVLHHPVLSGADDDIAQVARGMVKIHSQRAMLLA